MGGILYGKLTDNIEYTLTELANAVTTTGDINNLSTRSPIKNYVVTGDNISSQYRITVAFDSSVTARGVAFLGFKDLNPSFTLWTGAHGSSTVSYTADTTSKTRYIDGETFTDYLHIFDESETFQTLTFDVSVGLGTDYLGSIYIGESYTELKFRVNAKITPVTTDEKDRSLGGQVYSKKGIVYDTLTVSTAPDERANNLVAVKDLNIEAGTSEPIILNLEAVDEVFYYGTQKKLATSTPVLGKKSNNWMWQNNFSIEEEL